MAVYMRACMGLRVRTVDMLSGLPDTHTVRLVGSLTAETVAGEQ